MTSSSRFHKDAKAPAAVMAILPVHPYGWPPGQTFPEDLPENPEEERTMLFWTGAQIADWYKKAGPKAPQ